MKSTPLRLLCVPLAAALLLCAVLPVLSRQRERVPRNANATPAAGSAPRHGRRARSSPPRPEGELATSTAQGEAGSTGEKLLLLQALKQRDGATGGAPLGRPAAPAVSTASEPPQTDPLARYLEMHKQEVSEYAASYACPALGLQGNGQFKVVGDYFEMTQGSEAITGMVYTRRYGDSFSFMLRVMNPDKRINLSFTLTKLGIDRYTAEPAEKGLDCSWTIKAIGSDPPWTCQKPRCK